MKKILDEFTHIEDRALRHQKRRLRDGLCRVCGMPRARYSKVFCPVHLKKNRERSRAAGGYKSRELTGRGRPTNENR